MEIKDVKIKVGDEVEDASYLRGAIFGRVTSVDERGVMVEFKLNDGGNARTFYAFPRDDVPFRIIKKTDFNHPLTKIFV